MRIKKYKNINRFLINERVERFARDIESAKTVLDVGAGSDQYRKVFSNNQYLTVDIGMEQESNKGINIAADILNLPLGDSSIDYMLCVEVLEHIADGNLLLKELNRAIKNDGRLLITTPLCIGEHLPPYDYYRYTQHSLKGMLEANGFNVLSMEKRGGYFTLLGYLTARLPDQIEKSGKIPALIKKPLKRLLRWPFTYVLAPMIIKLECLDEKKNFTLGYFFEVQKVNSL